MLLVDAEAWPVGRELEQHAARLEEVHRLEPEAVDDLRRPPVRALDALAHRELHRFVRHAPRDVMHRAHTPRAARACSAARESPGAAPNRRRPCRTDASRRSRRSRVKSSTSVRNDAVSAFSRSHRRTACSPTICESAGTGLFSHASCVASIRRLDEREMLAVRIVEQERAVAAPLVDARDLRAALRESRAPILERARGNRQRDLDAESDAEPARRRILKREEGEIGARMSRRVGIKEVIRVRRILIHTLLHQAHAEHAGVEVEILLRVAGDRRDVMNAVDVGHGELCQSARDVSRRAPSRSRPRCRPRGSAPTLATGCSRPGNPRRSPAPRRSRDRA